MNAKTKTLIAVLLFAGVGLGVAYAAGLPGKTYLGVPVIFLCAVWAYALNWIAFVPAAMHRTERFYDFVGALTYISTIGLASVLSHPLDMRATLVAALVVIWATRLGSFLFLRIRRDKIDKRFAKIKTDPFRFLLAWTIQGTWVVLTSACALVMIATTYQKSWGVFASIGFVMWVVGFAIEVIADGQKSTFRRNPENAGRFIASGLWARSQHPNYFGEILLWIGIAVMALPILSGWSWIALISPVFVAFLLLRVSGVPLLQKAGQEKWGDDPDYIAYRAKTPVLIPRIF